METPEKWARVKQIFGEALERTSAERPAYLDSACEDHELRAEVESLLAAHAEAEDLSKHPLGIPSFASSHPSQTVGPYRLIRELGVGGMGQVWLAEQTEPVRRRVALKLIRAGMYDSGLIQRFQSERQSLAIMEHPAIAKVLDAGTTPEGQPYFAMEYVDGLSITDYCDRRKLGIRDRLKLFIQVCEGVQHAHQKAIIHRDLKPSNILVTEVEGKPTPRIIDFGLAKATIPRAIGRTLFTRVGAFLGTPGYISPEQADPNVHDIDTRTDVYSLGVVLYELLTGLPPFDTTQWKDRRLEDVLRELRETEPERPSTKVGSNRDTSAPRAEARNTEPDQLVSLLRGDLDWITLKAMEKERDRRYGTPSELSADIERYLANRPVVACPASARYRLKKYIRRHRVGVATATGAAVLLVAFAVMQEIQLRRITRERDRADRITEFMTNMFKVSDPSEARGNSITAREILDKSSTEIEAGLAKDPVLKAQMLNVMGTVYEGLGLYSQAYSLLEQAVEIRRHVLGPEDSDTLTSTGRLAWTISEEGHYPEAERMGRELVGTENRVFGPDNRITLTTESDLAWTLQLSGRLPEAENLFRQTLDREQRVLGEDDPDTLESVRRLAVVLEKQHRFAEAEKTYRAILEIRRRALGSEHPRTLKTMSDLGIVLVEEDRYPEAEQLLHQTLDEQTHILGPDHPDVIITMGNLATVLESEDRYPESEKLQREVLAKCRRVFGSDHPSTAISLYNIADVLYEEHRYREAATFFRETVDIQRRVLGVGHPDAVDSAYRLARVLTLMKKQDEGISVLRDAVDHGLAPEALADLETGADWKSLRGDPRFEGLIAEARRHSVAVAEKPK